MNYNITFLSSGENANGAIHARVTENGLNYINQQLIS